MQQEISGTSADLVSGIGKLLLPLAKGPALDLLGLSFLAATIATQRADLLGDGIDLRADLIALSSELTPPRRARASRTVS